MPDLSTATVPLWAVLTMTGGLVVFIIGALAWAFAYFQSKAEATEKHVALEARVNAHDSVINRVANDVAYIRGRLEPK